MKKLLILCLAFTFATELEVDGDLKVTGNVDVQNNPIKNVGAPTELTDAINAQILQDALRDNGPFEYLSYKVKIYTSTTNNDMQWIQISETGEASWNADFISELNTRALEGYVIHSTMNLPYATYTGDLHPNLYVHIPYTNNLSFTLFILKRIIEE